MAFVIADRVQETCSAPGTGDPTLLGAVTGFQTFLAAIGNGNSTYYCIADQGGNNWEVGVGIYTSSSNSLSRTTVLASSAGAPTKTNFSSGIQAVFVTYPAEKSVNLDGSGNVSALGTVTSGTWNGTNIGVTYGGTGGSATPTAGAVAYGTGSAYAFTSAGTAGQILTSNGSSAPTWQTPSTGVSPVLLNQTLITTAVTIDANVNGFSVGPVTLGTGGSVSVASGQRWVVI